MNEAWRYFDAGNYTEARQISLNTLEVEPTNPDALHLMGVFAYLNNQQNIAIELISAAIQVHHKYAPMHGNLALAKTAAGDLKGATASCRKALALNPTYADAHRVLGLILQKQGKLKDALREFQRAFKLGLNTEELRTCLTHIVDELGKSKQSG